MRNKILQKAYTQIIIFYNQPKIVSSLPNKTPTKEFLQDNKRDTTVKRHSTETNFLFLKDNYQWKQSKRTSVSPAIFKSNKNTLTGPTNCKKTTRHHAHLSLCAKSRKTNDAKSRKWPKTSIWAIF